MAQNQQKEGAAAVEGISEILAQMHSMQTEKQQKQGRTGRIIEELGEIPQTIQHTQNGKKTMDDLILKMQRWALEGEDIGAGRIYKGTVLPETIKKHIGIVTNRMIKARGGR